MKKNIFFWLIFLSMCIWNIPSNYHSAEIPLSSGANDQLYFHEIDNAYYYICIEIMGENDSLSPKSLNINYTDCDTDETRNRNIFSINLTMDDQTFNATENSSFIYQPSDFGNYLVSLDVYSAKMGENYGDLQEIELPIFNFEVHSGLYYEYETLDNWNVINGSVGTFTTFKPDNDTILLYHCDDIYSQVGYTVEDATNNSLNATRNSLVTQVLGYSEKAYYVTSTNSFWEVNDGDNSKLDLLSYGTIGTLYLPKSIAGTQTLISKYVVQIAQSSYHLYISSGYVRLSLVQNNGIIKEIQSPDQLQLNKWYHIAGSWNISSGSMELWINGELKAFGNLDLPLRNSTTKVKIGNMGNNMNIAKGYFDEVRISNISRSFNYSAINTNLLYQDEKFITIYSELGKGFFANWSLCLDLCDLDDISNSNFTYNSTWYDSAPYYNKTAIWNESANAYVEFSLNRSGTIPINLADLLQYKDGKYYLNGSLTIYGDFTWVKWDVFRIEFSKTIHSYDENLDVLTNYGSSALVIYPDNKIINLTYQINTTSLEGIEIKYFRFVRDIELVIEDYVNISFYVLHNDMMEEYKKMEYLTEDNCSNEYICIIPYNNIQCSNYTNISSYFSFSVANYPYSRLRINQVQFHALYEQEDDRIDEYQAIFVFSHPIPERPIFITESQTISNSSMEIHWYSSLYADSYHIYVNSIEVNQTENTFIALNFSEDLTIYNIFLIAENETYYSDPSDDISIFVLRDINPIDNGTNIFWYILFFIFAFLTIISVSYSIYDPTIKRR